MSCIYIKHALRGNLECKYKRFTVLCRSCKVGSQANLGEFPIPRSYPLYQPWFLRGRKKGAGKAREVVTVVLCKVAFHGTQPTANDALRCFALSPMALRNADRTISR
jgi:hypothetical protein